MAPGALARRELARSALERCAGRRGRALAQGAVAATPCWPGQSSPLAAAAAAAAAAAQSAPLAAAAAAAQGEQGRPGQLQQSRSTSTEGDRLCGGLHAG
eukprot:7694026-Pyramimonas_sp.AAC.2